MIVFTLLQALTPQEPGRSVYIKTEPASNPKRWVCLDARENRELWRQPFRLSYSWATVSPNEKVVALAVPDNRLRCLTNSGKTLWELHLDDLGEPTALLSTDDCVLIGKGTVTTNTLNYKEIDNIYRVDCYRNQNGKKLWSAPLRSVGKPLASLGADKFISSRQVRGSVTSIVVREARSGKESESLSFNEGTARSITKAMHSQYFFRSYTTRGVGITLNAYKFNTSPFRSPDLTWTLKCRERKAKRT